jgi:hypothetical protein
MALIYECLSPNIRDNSANHPLMAFKMSPDFYLKFRLNYFFPRIVICFYLTCIPAGANKFKHV